MKRIILLICLAGGIVFTMISLIGRDSGNYWLTAGGYLFASLLVV